MGMYNEVRKGCPECHAVIVVQIPQIVGGFGNFNLDDPTTYDDLTADQFYELEEIVRNKARKGEFTCTECHHNPFGPGPSTSRKINLENL